MNQLHFLSSAVDTFGHLRGSVHLNRQVSMIWFMSSSIPKQYDLAFYLNRDQHGKLWNLIQNGNKFWHWYLISLTWQVHHSKFYFYVLCSTSRDRLCLSPIPQHEELSLSLWCVTYWFEPIWKRPLHKAMLILCYEDHIDYFAEDVIVRYVNIHRRIQSRFNSFLPVQKILLLIWLYYCLPNGVFKTKFRHHTTFR